MPERIAGIKGYIGELIVRERLTQRHKIPCYSIKSQVLPLNVDPRGGPYLDLCVIKGNKIIKIFEVKTQDYRSDSLNKSLKYLWCLEKGKNDKYFNIKKNEKAYVAEADKNYILSSSLKSYLVLMCQPSTDLMLKIKTFHKNILYLKNDFKTLKNNIGEKRLISVISKQFIEDIYEVFKNIENPANK